MRRAVTRGADSYVPSRRLSWRMDDGPPKESSNLAGIQVLPMCLNFIEGGVP